MRDNRRILLFVLLLCTALTLLPAAEKTADIQFAGDYTRASLKNDQKSLTLIGNAWVRTEETLITADTIELYGIGSRYITCEGDVSIHDSAQGLRLTSNRLSYDREQTLLRVDGWAEMEDVQNGIIVKGAYLENSQQTGETLIQISVRIFKDTEDGPMICLTDSALYDSARQRLEMTGSSVVYWKGNRYHAAQISIDLEKNEITMEGNVKGNINE
ncbi:MAG: hypothetical protein K9M84_00600 [Spirochaetia bacterium]|nr:hypothetical protein [Spirochaetia bacterium]MCF7940086.1 hypothetical protein [Spirochaetia bacterium]